MCPECDVIQRAAELRLLAMEDRLLKQMDEEKRVLIDAFRKHLRRADERQRLGQVKRKTTMMLRHPLKAVIPLVLLLLSPFAAEAVGPRVGTGCVGSWTAPTTNVDGTPLTGPVTYKVWVLQDIQTLPAVPPTFVTAGVILPLCAGRTPGQYTLIVDDFVTAGTESAFLTFPFTLVIPAAPTGLVCTAGVCSWNPVTTFTDATAIVGPVTYNLTLTPVTTPATPPTVMVATGTSLPVSALPAGSYTARVSTVATPTVGGSISESAVSAAVPFAVGSGPNPPTNANVR